MISSRWTEGFIGLGLILLSLSHWFSVGINLLELLGAFAHFTAILCALILILSIRKRWKTLGFFSTFSLLFNLLLVDPCFSFLEGRDRADFTIGQFNIYHNNPTPALAIEEIQKVNADIFAIQELNENWKPIVDSSFGSSHPYKLEEHWQNCCYGIGLYSKYPLSNVQLKHFDGVPYIEAKAAIGKNVIQIVSFHTQAPAFPNKTKERNAQMQLISEEVKPTLPTVVFGDLNIVSWDKELKLFLQQSNLSLVKNGFIPTYPMDFGVPLIPIDHIMHSDALEPVQLKPVTLGGSDHRGLIAKFQFKE